MSRIAIAVLHYFPYGGLERNMLSISQLLAARGHAVTIFTLDWQGPTPTDCKVQILPARGLTNHTRAQNFADDLVRAAAGFDLRVGFNRLPHLDVCYIADTCFAAKAYGARGWWYRALPRSRAFLAQEAAVVGAPSATQVLLISDHQARDYAEYYQLDPARTLMLPPGINPNRKMPEDYLARRAHLRAAHHLAPDTRVLLAIGSDFSRKGLARSLKALAQLKNPQLQLWVIGDADPHAMQGLAKRLGVDTQVKFWGAQDAIENFLWLADALLHPAYSEAAGATLVEAIVAGLPVIATRDCGFASYIERFAMGEVISQTQADNDLSASITRVLNRPRAHWIAQAAIAGRDERLFSRARVAADFIEAVLTTRTAAGT